jgi:hypothetical protein
VDDRRTIEVTGSTVLLDNIDPGAALASLVIETASDKVTIGPCTRERLPDEAPRTDYEEEYKRRRAREIEERLRRESAMPRRYRRYNDPPPAAPPPVVTRARFAPIVQCRTQGPVGRYLVRVVYVSSSLTYRVQHDLAMTEPDKATIDSRFAVVTPPWRQHAELVLFDGVPGGKQPPREIARGPATLDGGTAVLVAPTRVVPAHVRSIYAGVTFEETPSDALPGLDTWADVWRTLELPDVRLPTGRIHVRVDTGGESRELDLDTATLPAPEDGRPQRIPLWIDPELVPERMRNVVENDGTRLVEIVAISVRNTGTAEREVWVEEHARPAKHRRVEAAWPKAPSTQGDILRNKLVIKPGRTERVGYRLVYDL